MNGYIIAQRRTDFYSFKHFVYREEEKCVKIAIKVGKNRKSLFFIPPSIELVLLIPGIIFERVLHNILRILFNKIKKSNFYQKSAHRSPENNQYRKCIIQTH